jgi:hypothetical protein
LDSRHTGHIHSFLHEIRLLPFAPLADTLETSIAVDVADVVDWTTVGQNSPVHEENADLRHIDTMMKTMGTTTAVVVRQEN